jgi:hypothetical protein
MVHRRAQSQLDEHRGVGIRHLCEVSELTTTDQEIRTMLRIRIAALLAALVLIPAAAQAQAAATTITACYVPKTGSVYRIQAPGAPDACKASHVQFSWESAPASIAATEDTTYVLITPIPPGETVVVDRPCPDANQRVLSGGFGKMGQEFSEVEVVRSSPFMTGHGWEVVARNNSTVWNQIVSFVRCSKPAATS